MENIDELELDPDEVQICNPFSIVNNRIDNFLKRKREESNDRNTRLYCSPVSSSNFYSSSRTCDTVSVKREKRSECYVERTEVHNITGPQCNGGLDPASINSYMLSSNSYTLSNDLNLFGLKPDIHERTSNLEKCLNIKNGDANIYQRLKAIEDRVLKLEDMLINSNGNYSLSNIFSNDELVGILNDNLKTEFNDTQGNCINNDSFIIENKNPSVPDVIVKKSKYTPDDIQKLINSIKRKNENTYTNKF